MSDENMPSSPMLTANARRRQDDDLAWDHLVSLVSERDALRARLAAAEKVVEAAEMLMSNEEGIGGYSPRECTFCQPGSGGGGGIAGGRSDHRRESSPAAGHRAPVRGG